MVRLRKNRSYTHMPPSGVAKKTLALTRLRIDFVFHRPPGIAESLPKLTK